MLTAGSSHVSEFNTYAGGAYRHHNTRTTLYDKTYFTTRVLPSIASLDYNQGSPDGGHVITVTGYSWLTDQTKVAINIQGVNNAATATACAIETLTKSDSNLFTATCKTAASAVTTGTYFKGAHGWKIEKWQDQDTWTPTGDPTYSDIVFNADIGYEAYRSKDYAKFTTRGKTMFCPPVTGEYYFWLMSDDASKLYMHSTAD